MHPFKTGYRYVPIGVFLILGLCAASLSYSSSSNVFSEIKELWTDITAPLTSSPIQSPALSDTTLHSRGIPATREPHFALREVDTGQNVCFNNNGAEIPCYAPRYAFLDGRLGRDAAAADGVLSKIGGGWGGFDYSKINNSGEIVDESTPLGMNPEDWACTFDNQTGLLWEIKINNPNNPRHFSHGFGWFMPDYPWHGGDEGFPHDVGLGCNFTLECHTQAYIEYINDLALCGRTDWRLPSMFEIKGIANLALDFHTGGSLDPIYFADDAPVRGYGGQWTIDTSIHEAHFAFGMNFDDGHLEPHPKGGLLGIRLVSGELVEPEPEGEIMCEGMHNPEIKPSTIGALFPDGQLVWDSRTELTWDRCGIGQEFHGEGDDGMCEGEAFTMTWQEAMQYVQQLNDEEYLGYNDWRMPDVKELITLLERQCAIPMLDVSVFPNTTLHYQYWSSTTYTMNPAAAWSVQFEFGHMLQTFKTDPHAFLRVVRGGAEFGSYESTLAFGVSGSLSGMEGTNVGLTLESDAGESEIIIVTENGPFFFETGLFAGNNFTVSVSTPPTPFQECSVENGSGSISGNVNNVIVTCSEPEPSVIEIDQNEYHLAVVEGGITSDALNITNVGGGILEWSFSTAYSGSSRGGIDCESHPSILINDSGTGHSAYGGNAAWPDGVTIVDKFTPESYPASIETVCLAFAGTSGRTYLDFEIVVFDDNGPDNGPGTELGAMAVSVTDLPQYSWPNVPIAWRSFNISGLYTTVDSGSLYVGARWIVTNPQVFMIADENPDLPIGHAGGYYSGNSPFQPTQERFENYRSMFIRSIVGGAQEPPTGCVAPTAVPWLSVSPTAGQTNEGDTHEVTININSSGLALGEYDALLCLHSNDADNPLIEIPVHLTVEEPVPGCHLTESSYDFGTLIVGHTTSLTGTVENTGTGACHITEAEISNDDFGIADLETPVTVNPGDEVSFSLTFTPSTADAITGSLTLTSPQGNLTADLSGTGQNPPVASVDPTDLSFQLHLHDNPVQTQTVTVSNIAEAGAANLEYAISIAAARTRIEQIVEMSASGRNGSSNDVLSTAGGTAGTISYVEIDGAPFLYRSGREVVTLTHSASTTIAPLTGVACPTPPSRIYRVFNLADFGISRSLEVTELNLGIETVATPGPTTIRLYTLSGTFVLENLTVVAETTLNVSAADNGTIVSVPISGDFEASDILVVEWELPRAQIFFGGNSAGQTGPTYVQADNCGGTSQPTDLATIDFPNSHWVLLVHGNSIGMLSIDPTEGSVAPGQSAEISITADSEGFEEGIYPFEVSILSNDEINPALLINVEVVITTVSNEDGADVLSFNLYQNYPNPSSGRTSISFDLPTAEYVQLEVFDLTGRLVTVLVDDRLDGGRHTVEWNTSGLASGVYLYRITAGTYTHSLRTSVVR